MRVANWAEHRPALSEDYAVFVMKARVVVATRALTETVEKLTARHREDLQLFSKPSRTVRAAEHIPIGALILTPSAAKVACRAGGETVAGEALAVYAVADPVGGSQSAPGGPLGGLKALRLLQARRARRRASRSERRRLERRGRSERERPEGREGAKDRRGA